MAEEHIHADCGLPLRIHVESEQMKDLIIRYCSSFPKSQEYTEWLPHCVIADGGGASVYYRSPDDAQHVSYGSDWPGFVQWLKA